MGMYTQFIFGCGLNSNTPKMVKEFLQLWLNKSTDISLIVPPENHPFFETDYWISMPHLSSSYFRADGMSGMIDKEIAIRCDIKNYKNEIEKFCDWISRYVADDGCEYVYGYKTYECGLPELLLMRDGKLVFLKWGATLTDREGTWY